MHFVFIALIALLSACESGETSSPETAVREPTEKAQDDVSDDLKKAVQTARDRQFSDEEPTVFPKPSDSVKQEFQRLDSVFFGEEKSRSFELAWNEGEQSDTRFLRLATTLDRHPEWTPKTVDEWYAFESIRYAGPLLSLYFDRARALKKTSPKRLAARPDVGFQLKNVKRWITPFAAREGFAFANALYRSNGWSGVEYAIAEPPKSSAFVSRPDRWLSGDTLGHWQLPEASAPAVSQGTVGPAYLEEFLDTVLSPSQSASIHQSWMSDTYRFMEDEKGWSFEFVSMWRTPSDAEQMVEAFDLGLRVKKRDAVFAVTRTGNRLAVVGVSDGEFEKALNRAVEMVRSSVSFNQSDKKLLTFTPTDYDRMIAGQSAITIDNSTLKEPISGFVFPTLGTEWEIKLQQKGALRWGAVSGKTAMQFSVELSDLLGPEFSSDRFGESWKEKFEATLQNVTVEELKKTKVGVRPAWRISLTGEKGGVQTRIVALLVDVDAYVATLSLVDGDADGVTRFNEFVDAIETPTTETRSEGSMTYTIE